MGLNIRKNGDPILREKTKNIKDPLDEKIQKFVLEMIETMHQNNGVGLAAPQVGKNLRICTIDVDGLIYVLINPKITAKSKTKIISEEGCLSFPGEFFPVARHSEVQVRYVDETGKPQKIKGKDLLARALQHEIDHLDGILIIDRIKKAKIKKNGK